MTAAEIAVGQRATVVGIDGMDSVSCRLLEMGLVPGTEVELLGKAPLGDPLEFAVLGYRLSLRRSEAARIEVNPS